MHTICWLLLFIWNVESILTSDQQGFPPKLASSAPVGQIRVLPGYNITCPATGTPPIYTAIIRNSTVLVNTTTYAAIVLRQEGNYTCVVTNKYGTDVGAVSVIFQACEIECFYEWFNWLENTLSCRNVTSPEDIANCGSKTTEYLSLSSNAIKFLSDKVFADLINLELLDLSSNAITFLPETVFSNLKHLEYLVKSYVNCLFDPALVPVWVTINKLYLVPKRVVSGVVGVFCNGGGVGTAESDVPVVFFDPVLHRSSRLTDVNFATFTGSPVNNAILLSGINSVIVVWFPT
ncbi:hypothetical protein ACROYT_G024718 [Oculina patagonica]